jgi:hypothetical protein
MTTNLTIFWLKYCVLLWWYGNRCVILNSAIDIDILLAQPRVPIGIRLLTTSTVIMPTARPSLLQTNDLTGTVSLSRRRTVFNSNGDEQLGFKLQSQFAQYQSVDAVDGDEDAPHLFHPLLHIPYMSAWLHQSPRARFIIGVIFAVLAATMYISGLWTEYFGLALFFIAFLCGMLLLLQLTDRRLSWWLF